MAAADDRHTTADVIAGADLKRAASALESGTSATADREANAHRTAGFSLDVFSSHKNTVLGDRGGGQMTLAFCPCSSVVPVRCSGCTVQRRSRGAQHAAGAGQGRRED